MRRLSLLLGLTLTVAMAVGVPPSSAQSPGPLPRALQPDGQLPLEGTTWRLRDYRHKGVDRSSGPEVAAWMTMQAGELKASGGCTPVRGRYGVVGSAVAFRLRGLKDNDDCAEQTVIVQLGLVDGLRRAASHQLVASDEPRGTELVLRSAEGLQLLRFEADDAASLEGSEWRLESLGRGGELGPADAVQPAVLTFRRQGGRDRERSSMGQIVGSTGCNGLTGEYFRSADVMSFGELERTDAPCSPALLAQEAAIVGVLDATSLTVRLPPDRLILTASDSGDSLEFSSASPLEGTTWLLSRLPEAPPSDSTVTLRLEDGRASGQGPCGSYSAGYASDGVFLSFSDIAGSGDEECGLSRTERAVLAALRSTVILDRTKPELRLLDARGQVLARFRAASRP